MVRICIIYGGTLGEVPNYMEVGIEPHRIGKDPIEVRWSTKNQIGR